MKSLSNSPDAPLDYEFVSEKYDFAISFPAKPDSIANSSKGIAYRRGSGDVSYSVGTLSDTTNLTEKVIIEGNLKMPDITMFGGGTSYITIDGVDGQLFHIRLKEEDTTIASVIRNGIGYVIQVKCFGASKSEEKFDNFMKSFRFLGEA